MWRRWLIGLAALSLWLLASPARAQQPVPAPPSEAVPAVPAGPAAGPAADAAPVASTSAAPIVVAPAPPAGEAPRAAPAPPLPFVRDVPMSPAPAPIARRWWFWAALGVAAVGLVVTAIAISPGDPYDGNANPGLVMPNF